MSATKAIAGVELPAAGTGVIDPGHAEVGFVGRSSGEPGPRPVPG
jgi:hypothetical protein